MNSQGLGQNGKNKKNKVVLKLKRKREDVPEETIGMIFLIFLIYLK